MESTLRRIAPLRELHPDENHNAQPGRMFVTGFVSQPLLTGDDEQALFAWMNFHRYRAEQLRRRAVAGKSTRRDLARIERELALADQLRNQIVASNLRLVVALAKKMSPTLDQMSELISEGVLPLIRAVELFDISLGNRFSTYATWAVRNQMVRVLKRAKTAAISSGSSYDLLLETLPARPIELDDGQTPATAARRVQSLLAELPDRERTVLQARFGLNGEPQGQSLADVATRVGLSKERVRQIVLKSLDRIRQQIPEPVNALGEGLRKPR